MMASYTLYLSTICLSYAKQNNINFSNPSDLIAKTWKYIFDFYFPLWEEDHREELCKKIIRHFFNEEIGTETLMLFKFYLETKMLEIMPYYNKLYESAKFQFEKISNTNITKTIEMNESSISDFKKTANGENREENGSEKTDNYSGNKKENGTETANNSSNKTGNDKTTIAGNNTENITENKNSLKKESDTPQGTVSNLENSTYLSKAEMQEDNNTISRTNSNTEENTISYNSGTISEDEKNYNNTSDEENERIIKENIKNNTYINSNENNNSNTTSNGRTVEKIIGYQNANPISLLEDYRKSIINIDMMIIDDLESLFMLIY